MERIPNGRYTKEFREEAVKMAQYEGLSVLEISRRLSLPKSTLENWIRVSKTGDLSQIGKVQRPLIPILNQSAIFVGFVIGSSTYFHIRLRRLFLAALISSCCITE